MTMRFLHGWIQTAVLGGALLGGAGAVALIAQTSTPLEKAAPAAPVQRNYLNKHVIQLPILIEERQRSLIQEIHLYVKDSPTSPWTLRDKVGPTQESFTFQAPRDGEYWFTMVTMDRQGRSYPADLRNEPPGLAVIIDTRAPVIELTHLGDTQVGTLIQCEIRSTNLDNGKTRLTFQGGDGVFRNLMPVQGRANVYCIPAEAVSTGVIRVSAESLAGNQTHREEHLNNLKANRTQQVGVAPQAAKMPQESSIARAMPKGPGNNGPEIVQRAPQEVVPQISPPPILPIMMNSAAKPGLRPDGTDGPRGVTKTNHEPIEVAPTPPLLNATHNAAKQAVAPEAVKRQIVNGNKVFLDYQIENAGLSGVGKVEVWITRDKGQSWHKIGEDAQRKGPMEIALPGEGLFGVTLVASNGRGVPGRPPATGDTPDGWIEVDTTKPFAQITSVASVIEDMKSVVHIHWAVTDKNLGDAAVDIFYAATPQGPWLPIAKGLKGEGQYRWTPPVEIGPQAHLRLIATDIAGNVGIASTLEPVLFDDPARPRAVIRNILTSMPTTSSPVMPMPVRVAPMPPPQIVQPAPMK
jgi:hypothetical protein